MKTSDEVSALTSRMDQQRSQLKQQFAPKPVSISSAPGASAGGAVAEMQPYEPRSMLMRLLVGNPQLLTRLATVALTGVLGLRGAPWLLRGLRLWLSLRRPHS